MKKQLILFLFFSISIPLTSLATNQEEQGQLSSESLPLFTDDPFFPSTDLFNHLAQMQQVMDRLMRNHFLPMQNRQNNLANQDSLIKPNEVQIEEGENELIYKIKQPQGNESKIDVTIKDGIFIIQTKVTYKTATEGSSNKSFSYSQSNYSQSFKLPEEYDPNSMDITTKDSNLIVTFKRKGPVVSLTKQKLLV